MGRTAKRLGLEIEDDLEAEIRFRRIEGRLEEVVGAGDLDADEDTKRVTSIPQVTGLRVVGSTPGAITLGWNAVPISDLRRYELDIAEDIGFSVNKQTFFVAGTQFQFSTVAAEGGGGGTVIYARVRAANRAGNRGPYSITLNTTTGQAQTEDIGEGEVTVENIDQITLEGITLVTTDTVHTFPVTSRLIFNPDHFYLAGDNSLGDDPIVNLNLALTSRTSGLIDVPAVGAATFNHGLNGLPDFMHAFMVNVVTDLNYSVGDHVPVTTDAFGGTASGNPNFTSWFNATQCGVTIDNSADVMIQDKTGGGTEQFTRSRWKFKFIAYKAI